MSDCSDCSMKPLQLRQIYPWRSLEGNGYWRSRDDDNHPLRVGNPGDKEMSARSIHITQDLEMSNVARDLDPPDTINKPARALPNPNVRTRAFS